MKRAILTILLLIMMASLSFAEYPELICGKTASLEGSITASGTKSYVIEFQRKEGYAGFFSIQPQFTGTGTLQITYERSNDGKVYNATPVVLTAGATTGEFYEPAVGTSFFGGFIKINFNETGGANPVVITEPGLCRQ